MNVPSLSQVEVLIKPPKEEGIANWLLVADALQAKGLDSAPSLAGAAATIAVETAHTFLPLHEYGTAQYFRQVYGKRYDYQTDKDGLWLWRGRGLIQLTGRGNYLRAEEALNLPLIKDPELACEMPVAAKVFCWYWKTKGLESLCNLAAEHGTDLAWKQIRYVVNGGLNGWDDFRTALVALGALQPENTSPDGSKPLESPVSVPHLLQPEPSHA